MVIGVIAAEINSTLSLRAAQAHLDEAHARFGEGEGLRKNLDSVHRYRDALELLDWNSVTNIGASLGVSKQKGKTPFAAFARLARLPGMGVRATLLGLPPDAGWAKLRQDLGAFARQLRDAGKAEG